MSEGGAGSDLRRRHQADAASDLDLAGKFLELSNTPYFFRISEQGFRAA
jgi:hypothetical protein